MYAAWRRWKAQKHDGAGLIFVRRGSCCWKKSTVSRQKKERGRLSCLCLEKLEQKRNRKGASARHRVFFAIVCQPSTGGKNLRAFCRAFLPSSASLPSSLSLDLYRELHFAGDLGDISIFSTRVTAPLAKSANQRFAGGGKTGWGNFPQPFRQHQRAHQPCPGFIPQPTNGA